MGWFRKIFGRERDGASPPRPPVADPKESTEFVCSRCGKTSGTSGTAGKTVVGNTNRFLDLVGQCQACRLLICGACAVKEQAGGLTRF